jgi:flagellar hook-associated protein 1
LNFLGLQTSLTGIRAAQSSLDTASNNVANANSEGYTRQRVSLSERASLQRPFGPIGTGVQIDGVERVRDAFLDTRVRATGGSFHFEDTKALMLQRTEELLGEPEEGLTEALSGVWDAFEDLANDPGDPAARQEALSSVQMLTARFRTIDTGLEQLRADGQVRLDGALEDTNALLVELDALNREIGSAGVPPNDLLDRRDLVVDTLSNLAGIRVEESDGMVHAYIGADQLVSTPGAPAVLDLAVHDVTTGELGALVTFLEDELPSWRDELDAFAVAFADAINDAHDPGDPLVGFTDPLDAGAATIATAITDPGDIVAGTDGDLDGSNAAEIAALRDGAIPGQLRAIVTGLGRATADATRSADAGESLFVSAVSARQAMHGVSLDEEMVSLVQHQRALEAASRVMTAVDEALDVLVNRTGVVGR